VETVDRVVAERGVAGLAATACVRVRDAAGEVVGSGFLVGSDLVATCAHVVADATGSDPYAVEAPGVRVAVDFPVLPGGPVARSARVHRWVPIAEDGTGDVALLRLDAPAPPGAVMPPVRRVDALWDHRFRAFGFPEGRSDGVWSTGVIRSGQGTGWFQLQGTVGDQPIEGGFSGCPVWDDETGAVVGITVAADRDPGVTTAYLIPVADVLGLDPELLPSPYRGLEPFDEQHAEYFFGRAPDVARLWEAMLRCPLVAVAGPSGTGKSSLVWAGLLPRLRAEGARVAQVRPRPDAPILLDVVAAALELADPGSAQARRERDAERIATALGSESSRDAALGELTAALAGAGSPGGPRMVLVVDQFEELAEATPDVARELLVVLAGLVSGGGPADGPAAAAPRVVLTVRGLALDEVLTPAVAEALGSGTVLVGPLDRARLREAIVRPAERAPGLAFDDGLVERILDDAGAEPGQLPLVESLLARLWAHREGGSLTTRAYEAAGGVAGALAAHAEQVVGTAFGSDGEQLERLRLLLTRLVVPGRDGRFVRRAVRYSELPEELRELVPPLAAGRLVVVAGGQGTAGTVELAHQSLIEHWPRLRDWLAADRDFLAWRAELDADQRRWQAGGRDDGGLRRGAALVSGEAWTTNRSAELTEDEREYLRLSQTRRHRDRRRRRVMIAALAVLALIAGTVTVIAVRGGSQLSARQAIANAETLAKASEANARTDPVLAAEMALAAWRADPNSVSSRQAMIDQYLALSSAGAVVTGSPGGKRILAVGAKGTLADGILLLSLDEFSAEIVTDPGGPDPQRRRVPADRPTSEGVPSPDGKQYAAIGHDGSVRLWDVFQTTSIELATTASAVRTLAGFAPDGSRVGWWNVDTSGRGVLTVYQLATRSFRTVTIGTPNLTKVVLTNEPNQVLIRQGRAGTPDTRVALHSISQDADVRPVPSDVTLADEGADMLTCTPGADPNRSWISVSDTVTGTLTRRLPLAGTSYCNTFWVSEHYILERLSGVDGGVQNVWRATDVLTGRAFHFATPPLDMSQWTERNSPWITMLPGSDGTPMAFVAVGPTVLRVRTSLEIPADSGGQPPFRFPFEVGGSLLAMDLHTDNTVDIGSYDPRSGQVLATRHSVAVGAEFNVWPTGDDLWILPGGQPGFTLTQYRLPSLEPGQRIVLPGDPDGPLNPTSGVAVTFGTAADGAVRSVLGVNSGVLSLWDAATGQQMAKPISLVDTPANRDRYRKVADLWTYPGHPTEALISTPNGRIQLWDALAGRMIREIPVAILGRNSVLVDGDRLIVVAQSRTIQVWNISDGRHLGVDIPAPQIETLNGVDADGHVVGSYADYSNGAALVAAFYDLNRGVAAGVMRPAAIGIGELFFRPNTIGVPGLVHPVQTLALTAIQWHDQLCRVVPAGFSQAALDLLPAGTDTSSPCAAH